MIGRPRISGSLLEIVLRAGLDVAGRASYLAGGLYGRMVVVSGRLGAADGRVSTVEAAVWADVK